MDASNFLSVSELEKIRALMQYLNDTLSPPASPIEVDCNVIDVNGDKCGAIRYDSSNDEYVFRLS